MEQSVLIENYLQTCIKSFDFTADETVISDLSRALQYRLEGRSPEAVKNTYLKDLEIPQIILFDILANRFPLVLKAQEIVSNAIRQQAEGKKHITILDLGIGRGVQAKRIIDVLNTIEGLETITLIGVEILKDALDFTTELMNDLSSKLNIQYNFIPICSPVESLDVETINNLIHHDSTCLCINASLTLHHIQSDESRSEIFRKITSLKPALVTLIEPNTDCQTNNFEQRLKNVYEHFSALYQFINTLHLLPEEKKGLKQFFSTELFDSVALPDEHRFERYAPSTDWLQMGKEQGLTPFDISSFSKNIKIENITIENPASGFTNFKYHHSNILGIIALHT